MENPNEGVLGNIFIINTDYVNCCMGKVFTLVSRHTSCMVIYLHNTKESIMSDGSNRKRKNYLINTLDQYTINEQDKLIFLNLRDPWNNRINLIMDKNSALDLNEALQDYFNSLAG